MASQWITLAQATDYDLIEKEQQIKNMIAKQENEIMSFQRKMGESGLTIKPWIPASPIA